jgi:histidine triad (HIT) family protein
MAEACLFCSIANGEGHSEILFRDQQCFVIRDINPKAPIHLLIIPLSHIGALEGNHQFNELLVGHLFKVAASMAGLEGAVKYGYRLAINQGENAGQTVRHLHVHLLGGRPLGPEA